MDTRSPSWEWKWLTLLLGVLAVVSVAQGCRTALSPTGSLDFGLTLKAATTLLHENPYRADIHQALKGLATRPVPNQPQAENPYPAIALQAPSALALLWPLVPLSWPAAKLVWLILNLGFTAGTLRLAFRRYLPGRSRWDYAGLTSLLLAGFPWRVVIGNGQHVMAALFFFLLATEMADRGHRMWAGLALAASFVKYSVSLFLLPLFIAKRQWGPLVLALGGHALATVAIAARLGENPVVLMAQSLAATGRTVTSWGYIDLFAAADAGNIPVAIAITAAAMLTTASLWLAYRRRPPEPVFVSLLCLLALVVVYHRFYDLVILVVPLIIVAGAPRDRLLQLLLCFAVVTSGFVSRFILWLPQDLVQPMLMVCRIVVAVTVYATLGLLLCRAARGSNSSARPIQRP